MASGGFSKSHGRSVMVHFKPETVGEEIPQPASAEISPPQMLLRSEIVAGEIHQPIGVEISPAQCSTPIPSFSKRKEPNPNVPVAEIDNWVHETGAANGLRGISPCSATTNTGLRPILGRFRPIVGCNRNFQFGNRNGPHVNRNVSYATPIDNRTDVFFENLPTKNGGLPHPARSVSMVYLNSRLPYIPRFNPNPIPFYLSEKVNLLGSSFFSYNRNTASLNERFSVYRKGYVLRPVNVKLRPNCRNVNVVYNSNTEDLRVRRFFTY